MWYYLALRKYLYLMFFHQDFCRISRDAAPISEPLGDSSLFTHHSSLIICVTDSFDSSNSCSKINVFCELRVTLKLNTNYTNLTND